MDDVIKTAFPPSPIAAFRSSLDESAISDGPCGPPSVLTLPTAVHPETSEASLVIRTFSAPGARVTQAEVKMAQRVESEKCLILMRPFLD
jgi:hypothetical protein